MRQLISRAISGNRIGLNCYNISISGEHNVIGDNCCDIIAADGFSGNTFGNDCWSNSFGNYFQWNTFGNYCYDNSFGNDCYNNQFGNGCYNNQFGNSCRRNSFGNNCGGNQFGNGCGDNQFGNGCNGNQFGNDCYNNQFGNNVNYVTVHNGVQYVSVAGSVGLSGSVNYAQILNGTHGSYGNLLQIPFQTMVSYTQFAALTSNGELRIWNPADLVPTT